MLEGSSTRYEKTQNYNFVTRLIHSARYLRLSAHMRRLSQEITDRPIKVMDIGCGPGSAVKTLIDSFNVDYVGIDYDPTFIDAAKKQYGNRRNCRFVVSDASERSLYTESCADIVIALETFEHIPGNRVVDIIEQVCHTVRPKVFLVTVPVEIGPAVWIKNWGAALMGYDRQSGNFLETFWAGLYQLDRLPPHRVSHLGFDWRWLAQTMRFNTPLKECRSLPISLIPKWLAPNVELMSTPAAAPPHHQKATSDWRINHGLVGIWVSAPLYLELLICG